MSTVCYSPAVSLFKISLLTLLQRHCCYYRKILFDISKERLGWHFRAENRPVDITHTEKVIVPFPIEPTYYLQRIDELPRQ